MPIFMAQAGCCNNPSTSRQGGADRAVVAHAVQRSRGPIDLYRPRTV